MWVSIFTIIQWMVAIILAAPAARNANRVALLDLQYFDTLYYVESLKVGTMSLPPKQVVVDTGSSDFVLVQDILTNGSGIEQTTTVAETGYYSTEDMNITEAYGTISEDKWQLTNTTLGIAPSGSLGSFSGILGLGYDTDEAFDQYENLPLKLKSDGVVEAAIYAFYGKGEQPYISFGGIDPHAYKGLLIKTAIVHEIGTKATREFYNVLAITVNSLKLDGTTVSNQKLMYSIDSGSNVLATSEPVQRNIESLLGNYKQWNNTQYFELSKINSKSLEFDVTGFPVKIPLKELVDDIQTFNGKAYGNLRIVPVEIGYDSYEGSIPNCIFKYYYTVFDLESNSILFAPFKYDPPISHPLAVLEADNYPVQTETAPNYSQTYSTLYQNSKETTIHHKRSDVCTRSVRD